MLTIKQYCDKCGSKLAEPGHANHKQCTNITCNKKHYDNPIVGVAGIYIQNKKLLLGKRCGSFKTGLWCMPCGYLEHENVTDGVVREFHEETGLTPTDLQIYASHTNYGNPNQLTVGIYYLISACTGTLAAADDLADVQFFSMAELEQLPIAFNSDKLVIAQLKAENRI